MIVKQTGVGGDGERLEEHSSITVMQLAPVHPLKVGREQGAVLTSTGEKQELPVREACVYWLRNTHSVVCWWLLNLFTW